MERPLGNGKHPVPARGEAVMSLLEDRTLLRLRWDYASVQASEAATRGDFAPRSLRARGHRAVDLRDDGYSLSS